MGNKFYRFDLSVTGGLSGLCEAPDRATAESWIRDEYSFGDLDVDEVDISLFEKPASLIQKAGLRVDVGPSQ